jgi:tetratricopeptide (TPR) repeat protein
VSGPKRKTTHGRAAITFPLKAAAIPKLRARRLSVKPAKGQPAEALRLTSEAMRLRKPSPQILLNYGMILHALNRIDETLASFDAALKQKSRFAAGLSDVFLDSIGWSGCNSALECLTRALPIVTFEGATMRGRHSAAILRMIGVEDTIATTVDDYVAIARASVRTHSSDARYRHE